MHQGHAGRSTNFGFAGHPAASHHPGPGHSAGPRGFCTSCCHPAPSCCCTCRECRKEAKELLVKATLGRDQAKADIKVARMATRAAFVKPFATAFAGAAAGDADAAQPVVGMGEAFIGGGCCVHLSVEYVPTTATAPSIIVLTVDDSQNTVLGWGKLEQPGTTYQIKECVVTTRPGADLNVMVVNMTARVRWCEVFSC